MAIQFPIGVPVNYIHAASNGINYQWDGVKWTTQTDGSNSSIGSNPGPNPPANPVNGDFWFDTTNGQLYVYEGQSVGQVFHTQRWLQYGRPS